MAKRGKKGYDSILPISLGDRIKRYRELRNMSQKELGIKCGFPESSAAVRIANYESNKKVPRDDALKDLARALEVHEAALYDTDFSDPYTFYHVLFDLYDIFNIFPRKISEGLYVLDFAAPHFGKDDVRFFEIMATLEQWDLISLKCLPNPKDSEEEIEIKKNQYRIWMAQYPNDDDKAKMSQMADEIKMRILQDQMDSTYARMKSRETLIQIEEALNELPRTEDEKEMTFVKMSDFMILIESIIERGLKIEKKSPLHSDSLNKMHLFSIRVDDILSSVEMTSLFDEVVRAIEILLGHGIEINKEVSSKEKELFISYTYTFMDGDRFDVINKYWDDMLYIIEEKDDPHAFGPSVEDLEKQFLINITGKDDYYFDNKKT